MITDKNKEFLLQYSPDHRIRHEMIASEHLSYRQRSAISSTPFMNGDLADKMFNSIAFQGDKFDLVRKHFDSMHPDTKNKIINSSYQQKGAFAGTSDQKIINQAIDDPNNHFYLTMNRHIQPHHIDAILDHMNQNREKYSQGDMATSLTRIGKHHELNDSHYAKFKDLVLVNGYRHDIVDDMKHAGEKNKNRLEDLESAAIAKENQKKSILDIEKP